MQDANGQLDFDAALRMGRVLDDLNYYWYEEPIPDRQIQQVKALSQALKTPVIGAEQLHLAELPEYIRQRAFDMVRAVVLIKGGVTGLRKAVQMCEMFGINLEIHTAASPLLDVANLHVACTTRHGRFTERHSQVFNFALENNPLLPDENGYVHVPSGTGLGVDLDWNWIEDNTLEIQTTASCTKTMSHKKR